MKWQAFYAKWGCENIEVGHEDNLKKSNNKPTMRPLFTLAIY